jgi:hypothetical protein
MEMRSLNLYEAHTTKIYMQTIAIHPPAGLGPVGSAVGFALAM